MTFRSTENIPRLDLTEDNGQEDIICTPEISYSGERAGPSPCEISLGEGAGSYAREIFQKRKKMDIDAEFLKELRSLRECITEFDDDKYFLLSILPLMKKLSPQANMVFRIETQQNLMQKLFPTSPVVPSPYSSDSHDTSHH